MGEYDQLKIELEAQLADLVGRSRNIEADLQQQLDPDLEEQAADLAGDEALSGIDEVLQREITAIRHALLRIENGTYGICAKCGGEIGAERMKALPTATICIDCA